MSVQTPSLVHDEILELLAHGRRMSAGEIAGERRLSVWAALDALKDLASRGLVDRQVVGDPDCRQIEHRPVATWGLV